MTESQVYCWLMLDNISAFLLVFGSLLLAFGLIAAIALSFELKKHIFWLAPAFGLLLLVIGVFCPDTKQYATIKILPKILNSDFAKQVPDDIEFMYNMAKEYTKEVLSIKKESK